MGGDASEHCENGDTEVFKLVLIERWAIPQHFAKVVVFLGAWAFAPNALAVE